jgi:hypothetical protein
VIKNVEVEALGTGVLAISPALVENATLELNGAVPVDKIGPEPVERATKVEFRYGGVTAASLVETTVEFRRGKVETPVDIGKEIVVENSPPFVETPVPVARMLLVEFAMGKGGSEVVSKDELDATPPFVDNPVPLAKTVLVEFKTGNGGVEEGTELEETSPPLVENPVPEAKTLLVEFESGKGALLGLAAADDKISVPSENGGRDITDVLLVGIGKGAEDVISETLLEIGNPEMLLVEEIVDIVEFPREYDEDVETKGISTTVLGSEMPDTVLVET